MDSLKLVSIKNYLSSLWILHDYHGYKHVDIDHFLIKCTLSGAKRILGCESRQVDPLSPEDMIKIFKSLDMTIWEDLAFWCALTLCYRCLLRSSHVTISPHTMKVKDISFWRGGMDVVINSSKTIQYRERKQLIPVIQAFGSPLCPVDYLKEYIIQSGLGPAESVFPYIQAI